MFITSPSQQVACSSQPPHIVPLWKKNKKHMSFDTEIAKEWREASEEETGDLMESFAGLMIPLPYCEREGEISTKLASPGMTKGVKMAVV